jgi:hypothetical protein
MRIKFDSCPHCYKPLHRKWCNECSGGGEAVFENKRTREEREHLITIIERALEENVKVSIFLTRAVY